MRAKPRSLERARLAAKLAHDEPMTRYRAALILRVDLADVLEAWRRMYPENRRTLT